MIEKFAEGSAVVQRYIMPHTAHLNALTLCVQIRPKEKVI